MKKLNLFLALTVVFTLFSCGNDDDGTVNTSDLIGKWGLISRVQQGSEASLDNCEKSDNIEFKSDGTYKEEIYAPSAGQCVSDGVYSGTWSESSNTLTLKYTDEGDSITDVAKFLIVDNKLTITYNDEDYILILTYEKK